MTQTFDRVLHNDDLEVSTMVPTSLRELLQEEFLDRFGMDMQDLSSAIHMSVAQIDDALNGNRQQLPELSLRLARYFGTSARFWMSIDSQHSLEVARNEMGSDLYEIDPHGRSIFDDGEDYVVVSN